MSVTPDFIGQIYKDTATGNLWIANSTTAGDWSLELQNMKMFWEPKTEKFYEYVGLTSSSDLGITDLTINGDTSLNGFSFYGTTTLQTLTINLQTIDPGGVVSSGVSLDTCTGLLSAVFPNLTEVGGNFAFGGCSDLATISIPLLETVLNQITCDGSAIASFSAPSLTSIASGISLQNNANLTSVSFPVLVSSGGTVTIKDNSQLTSFSAPNWLPDSSTSFAGNALNQTSVDHILARCVANAGLSNKIITLSGGTNSAPSASGLADKATLEGRVPPCTVNVNP